MWASLFKRDVVEKIRFDETLAIGEDTYFWANCVKRASSVVCLDRALYYYSKNDDSVTGEKYSPKKMDHLRAWNMLCELLDSNSFSYKSAKAGYAQTAETMIRMNCNNDDFMGESYSVCKKIWYENFKWLLYYYLRTHKWVWALKALFSYFFWDVWLWKQKRK